MPIHYQTTISVVTPNPNPSQKVTEDSKKAAVSSRKTSKDIFAAARFNLGRESSHKPINPETMNQIADLSFMLANVTLDTAVSAKSAAAGK